MRMPLQDFLELTPGQFSEAYHAFRELREAERWQSELQAWQVARWQVWRTLAPPDKKEISVMDLIELPGDEQIKAASQERKSVAGPSSRERFEQLAKKWS